MTPREAAHRTMDEVGGALIAIALVLCAVFIPAAFITGISGQFFRQFAVTIASATIISCFVSLTLSPALCALLFKPHTEPRTADGADHACRFAGFFRGFNWGFDRLSGGYGGLTRRLVRLVVVVLVVYRRPDRAHRLAVQPRADRLHPAAGPGLPDHRHPAAARQLAGAHRRGRARSDQDHAGDAGRRPCRAVRRLRRRHLHQCAQRRRHLLGPGAVRGTRPRKGSARPAYHRRSHAAPRRHPGRLHHHHPAAAGARHRQFRRLQDDDPGQARPRPAGARRPRPRISSAPPIRRRAWPASSRCSTRARPRSMPTSTACGRRCWA